MAHWIDTPGHGWLVLSPEENARVPAAFRMPDYEEDCAWSIAVLAVPALLEGSAFKHLDTPAKRAATLERARETCRNYYPDAFAAITGEQPTCENSVLLAELKFHADHANDWVVISAVGDICTCGNRRCRCWHDGVPKGFVLGTATQGGQRGRGVAERDYLILQSRYVARDRCGYVIRPDDKPCAE
jgi:hypothetical protein